MLRTLRIRNFVIVEDLTVEFDAGLNLLTGEAGAGKSILVDALSLIAGARADRSAVRSGETRAVVEALFECDPAGETAAWCARIGLDEVVDGQIVVHREVSAAGSGRALVNGSPCTLAQLRQLGEKLLELHGQHQQQTLLVPERHLELLDRFGDHANRLADVAGAHAAVLGARDALGELAERQSLRGQRIEQLERTVREIESAGPEPGELDRLDRDRRVLQSADRMSQLLDELVRITYEGEPAAFELVSGAAARADELAAIDPDFGELAGRLRSAAVELQDAGSAVRDYRDRQDFDPLRLESVEARRVEIERLCLRHGADEAGLLELARRSAEELQALLRLDDELQEARELLASTLREYTARAAALTRARKAAARKLVKAVESQFASLALGQARFEVGWSEPRGPSDAGESGAAVPLNVRGAERAAFHLAANPGEPLRPLAQVASGGELSRIMLALHVVVEGRQEDRSMVFDEVDAGVGGAVADAVGARLAALGRRHQVLCVTHLAQVAAHGDHHFRVEKSVSAGRTSTCIRRLSDTERIDELARMVAGKRPTATSREHAAALLSAASRSAGAPPRPARRRA